jgi:uncharacterized Zn-binding protein involved in type VI secretion
MANVIRVGDPTSHGGKVTSSSASQFTVEGVAVVVVGDDCICPVQGHQICKVASGSSTHTINGKAVAYDGDKTTCGATLISTIGTFLQS